MFGFTPDATISLLRHVLTFVAGIIVAKGWITADMAAQLVGGVIAVVGVLFAAFFHASSNGTVPTISTTPNATKEDKLIIPPVPAIAP